MDPKCFLWKTKTELLNHSIAKISAFCDAHLFYLIYNSSQGQQSAFYSMSDQSDSQNRSEEQIDLSQGTSPSNTSDEGSRSTPSNLPKAATRQRRKRTSDSEDEDYKAEEDEATSKKVVLKKEYGSAKDIKPGMKIERPARRNPMPRREHQLNCLKILIPKSQLMKARRGRKGSRRPWPEL